MLAVTLLLAAAGCDRTAPARQAPDLESAAIDRGLVRDPAAFDPIGLYARDTDRLCLTRAGEGAYHVGASVDYGQGIACTASGSAERTSGGALHLDLGRDCRLDVRFDGDRVTFPANLPDACRRFCTGRASLAAIDVTRLSDSASEAAAMRDAKGRLPCSRT